ncbi:Ubiquitin carboxyl-terminal hydrolase 34 [Fusarium oxysporum f. sp. rapae]|uniref:Ubiquitin carboxyl-terminal hydrolase 34 n=1 Tax=Fusarium oxysporum f. sp. rapae TaxID=485398 RepID=A0A8J5NR68_FUSOX|nr:Ubiquitin carboxyl-terminal hydrolase 34 [Fusarium oxysporum f. sp. rapae]
MDPASRSPALPDRAASAEASSTRPNPFDDGNISSRKRQRTSLSGSPTNSHSTVNPGHDSSRSTTLDTEPVLPQPGSTAVDSHPDSVAPKTSDPGSPVCDPLTEPPSSMATLNLRNAPENDSTSSPPPPPNVAQSVATEITASAFKDQVKESVEDAEVAMVPPPRNLNTPRSSFSHSASPPIEVITVQSDDDMASDRQSIGVSIVDDDSDMIDPINEFPFREPTETLEGMVVRLSNYIETQSSIDAGVIYKLQQWLGRYLDYIATANQQSVVDSCRLNLVFWVTFPRIITAMAAHKPPFLADDLLRHPTKAIFLDYARLSAWFVNQDIHTIKEFIAEQGGRGQQTVELFCPCYLQNLHSITNPLLLSDDQHEHFGALSTAFLKAYQDSPGGSLSRLLQLIRALFQVIPTYPRLTNDLAPICLVASDIMEDSCNFVTPETASKSNQKLLIGHTLLDLIYERLDIMIDKSPTHLIADSVLMIVQALSNMINIALKGDHAAATLMLEEHRAEFPAVPLRYTAEAISYEHRFRFLIKLIKSSQMQLRFQGMTQMCKELIAFWKRHYESKADDGSHYVEHIAEYLIRTGFIDYLLGANCHPEIIVEGANIIGFIIVTRRYRRMHIDRVWEGIASRQDPRTADALARMVIQIAHLFDDDGFLLLCEKFQTLPIDAFTPVIRMLWEGVMKHMADKCSADRPLVVQPYNLCLRLLRDSSVCASGSQVMYPDIQQAAMQKLRELLRCGPNTEGQQQLYLGCLQDLANKSATTLGSLWCLFIALRSRNLSQEMHWLVEHHDLTRLVIEELEHAIGAGQAAGILAVLSCSVNQPRKEFIANLIQLEPPSITEDLGVKLWDMLVGPISLSPDDRRVGWEILNSLHRRNNNGNPFLQACLTYHLPALSSEYFCEGMLEFLRIEILPRLNDNLNLALDDPEAVATSGIEQLWRLILEAEDETLVDRAIRTLAVDIYIDSRFFNSISTQRAQSIHLKLASRCLEQLKSAAQELRNASQGTNSDDQVVVTAITQRQLQQQERVFTRSLKFLRYILEAHQSKPSLSAPDLRTLIPQASHEVQGDSAGLKYQSFDGDQQTDIKPLVIGKANTAASLLASLRQETGFENYRIYYRGRPFLPSEQDICRSLEDLCVHDGLILVRREDGGPALSNRVRPGASPLEIEISAHFDEMWEYLSMDEALAQEIYYFLIKLPTDGHFMRLIGSETTSSKDIFPSGQPFKSLYAVHALIEYAETLLPSQLISHLDDVTTGSGSDPVILPKALKTPISFIVQAISDEDIFNGASVLLRLKLASTLLHALRQFLDRVSTLRGSVPPQGLPLPDPNRLVKMLSYAIDCPGDIPSPVIAGALVICLRLSMLDDKFWAELSTNPDFNHILHRLLLIDSRQTMRSLSVKLIEELFTVMSTATLISETDCETSVRSRECSMAEYFWKVTSAMVRQTTVFPSQCEGLLKLVYFLVVKINARSPELLNIEKFASQISQLLLEHTTTETIGSSSVDDSLARGLSSLLHICLQLDNSVAQSKTLPSNLAMSLVWKHLYPPKGQRSGQPVPKVILNEETRAKLSDVLFILVKHDQKKMVAVVEALDQQVPFFEDEEDDHYIYDLTYHFDRHRALRASCGYAGLLNLSNTCYLNSLMTQLFMNTTFRRFILGCCINDPANSQQLLSYTQKLFGHMQESYRRFVDPSNFVHSIKTYDDALIDIHNQMDVDEFYNLLLDRWETQLSGHDEKRVIKSFYGGQLVQQVKSKECEHISERLEPFSAIQCDIKGKGTLAESLQAYVDGEVMEGDNKYKCSTCDRHVDAVKRACLKDVPDNVIFHLKRFDFNLRTLQRNKINDYFSFPDQIDMRPYTIEHLSNPKSDIEEDIFELVGVLVHAGTAESGHYYSYIRERPSSSNRPSWVEFNDDLVTPWDPAQMEYSTFGGPDHRPIYDTNGILYDKNYSAYMLFYQRSSSLRAEQEKMLALSMPAPLRVGVPDHLADHLSDENTNILRRHCIYDPSNVKLVQVLFRQSRQHCRSIGRSEKNSSIDSFMAMRNQEHGLQDLAMRTLIGNLDQVVTRTKDTPDFLSYEEIIEDAVTSCERCAFSFYEYFNQHPSALRMLLQRNPDQLVRSKIRNLFKVAVTKISKALPNVYDPEIRYTLVHDADGDETLSEPDAPHRSVIDGVMMIFQHLWKFFHIHIRAWDEYFGTVLDFAEMGHRETGYVLAANFLASAIRIISADPLQELSGNWARMLQGVIRRNNTTKPTSYVSIIRLINHLMSQMRPQIGAEYVEDPTERASQLVEAFSWTSEEVDLIYSSPNGSYTSLFVEKLLTLDQEHAGCNDIIRILTKLDDSMDEKVLGTLKLCIRGETSTQAMDPFLRASITYLESTEQLSNAKDMIEHVSMQAKSLQNTEGVYFVQLFRTALDLHQQDREFCKAVRTFSRDLIPKWVPFLLASPEEQVRRSTEDFLVCELGKIDVGATSDRDVTLDGQVSIRQMIKQIGLICLQYLRDHHVRRRAQMSREIADKFLKVIEGCAATAVATTADTQTELDVEFLTLQEDVLNPFRRLIVDELEEDGSDWEGSCGSSEQLDDIVEMNIPGMNEINDLEQMS